MIFTLQENRSFDNYFGRLGAYRAAQGLGDDINGQSLSVTLIDKQGNPVQPFHQRTVCHENISPSWNQSHFYYDNGKMDLFMHTATTSTIDPGAQRAMGYYDENDLPYYYALATEYATSDAFFSSVMTETVPNRLYLFGATSWGAIKAEGPFPKNYTLIFDRLNDKGISWKYYLQDSTNFLAQFPGGTGRYGSHFAPISEYYTDLHNESTFPQVAFIERAIGWDEHPGNNVQKGPARMKQFIDALMASPVWPKSAFILAFDEGGGMYDHVPPIAVPAPDDIAPTLGSEDIPGDFTLSGFRVPLIVVSPWVKPHYVSHQPREMTAILKFIENRFGLDPLTHRDAAADGFSDIFDFASPPRTKLPDLPSQPQNGTCSFSMEMAP